MFARFAPGLLRLLLERQPDVKSVPLFCRDALGLRDRRRLGALFSKAYQHPWSIGTSFAAWKTTQN